MANTKEKKRILTIEDENVIRQGFADFLEDIGYDVLQAENGKIGLEIIKSENPDLVLTDLRMPVMGGMEVLEFLKEKHPEIPVIIVSGTGHIADAIEAVRLGAWDYVLKPIQDMGILEHAINKSLERSRLLHENLQYREHLEEEIQKRTQEIEVRSRDIEKLLIILKKTHEGTINTITKICEVRDPYTGGHQQRVAELAREIASKMDYSKEEIEGIYTVGMLHDVGKIAVPVEILSKPGTLRPVEYEMLKIHPEVGYTILKEIDFIIPLATIVLQHHERRDGSGYPAGLLSDDIMLEAQIIAVADVMEAMMSHRPYRASLGIDAALGHIKEFRDIYYEPQIVDICVELFLSKSFDFPEVSYFSLMKE